MSWILLVEDDPDHRILLEKAIRQHRREATLTEVESFEEATVWLEALYRRGGALNDGVIILDLGLPGPSGFRLLEWLREVGLAALPVFVLTASENPMDADHAFNLGARGYFQKPADFREYGPILEKVMSVLPDTEREEDEG